MPVIAKKLTWDDIKDLPEDAGHTEIVDGDLVMAPPPSYRHQRIATALGAKIYPFVRENQLGEFFSSPVHVILADHVNYEPDLCFVAGSRSDLLKAPVIQGPPDPIIEIISESNRTHDTTVKFHYYEQYGVREYWIVDPCENSGHVYRLQKGSYVALGAFAAGERVETGLLQAWISTPRRSSDYRLDGPAVAAQWRWGSVVSAGCSEQMLSACSHSMCSNWMVVWWMWKRSASIPFIAPRIFLLSEGGMSSISA